jgi:hypothetical protein
MSPIDSTKIYGRLLQVSEVHGYDAIVMSSVLCKQCLKVQYHPKGRKKKNRQRKVQQGSRLL